MKRIICLILALLLLCPTAFAAKDLTFTFSKAEGKVGDTVTVTVSAKGAPVACSFKHVLVYNDAILKPVAVENINSKGFFMNNLETTYEGKAAVNVLTADAKKAFEGDCDLYTVSFEILSAPLDGDSASITIPYYECYDANLKKLDAAFDPFEIKILKEGEVNKPEEEKPIPEEPNSGDTDTEEGKNPEEQPSDENQPDSDQEKPNQEEPDQGETNADKEQPDSEKDEPSNNKNETDNDKNQANDDQKNPVTDKKPAGNTDETPETNKNDQAVSSDQPVSSDQDKKPQSNQPAEQDKKPQSNQPAEQEKNESAIKGDWNFFENTDEVTLSKDGDVVVYKGEFIRDEEDKLTGVELYDEEGKPAGSLVVEEKEDGTIEVIEEKLPKANETEKGFNHLYWILPLAALLIAGAITALLILKNKKSKEEE